MRSPAHTLRITLPISFALAQVAGAQAFGPSTPIDTQLGEPWCVQTSDVDLDGDLDVLVAARTDGMVGWYENDGSGQFGPLQTVTTEADEVYSFVPADLDGDGDEDLLVASAGNDTVAWHENTGGAFGPRQIISTAVNGARSIVAADLDGDGDLDALVGSMLDDRVSWFENLGVGAFGPLRIITDQADFVLCVDAADMDGDGDVDVLSASRDDDTVAWYANDGSGGGWSPTRIGEFFYINNPSFVRAADLDGDGDQDVALSSMASGSIQRFLQVEGGWFDPTPCGSGGLGTCYGEGPIAASGLSRPSAFEFVDVDGDLVLDLISSTYGNPVQQGGPPSGQLSWFEGVGGAAFGAGKHLALDVDRASFIHTADLDGDLRPDVLATSYHDGVLRWHRNEIPVAHATPLWVFRPLGEPVGLRFDLDGDGDDDAVNGTVCEENLGGGTFGPPIELRPTASTSALDFRWSDVDGDGDLDLAQLDWAFDAALGLYGVVSWFENQGLGGAYIDRGSLFETWPCGMPDEVGLLVEVNGGGPPEVLTLGTGYMNGSCGGVITEYDPSSPNDTRCLQVPGTCNWTRWLFANSYLAADLDQDQHDYLFYSDYGFAEGGNEWHPLPTSGLLPLSRGTCGESTLAPIVRVSDFEGDGDLDLLITHRDRTIGNGGGASGAELLVLAENLAGKEWSKRVCQEVPLIDGAWCTEYSDGWVETCYTQTFHSSGSYGSDIIAIDLDQDGHLDLMSPVGWKPGFGDGQFRDKFIWWSTPTALPSLQLSEDGRTPVRDMNGDGRPDVVGVHQGIYGYWENIIGEDCDGDGVADSLQLAAEPTLDLNANGTLDACEAIGTTYCSPAVANSSGLPGVVTILGNETVFLNDFKVSARQLPASAFGYFIASTTPGSVFPVSNSVGTLCVIGSVGRGIGGGIVNSGPDGFFYGSVNLNAMPQPVGTVMVQPGDTWHFQAWHRDASGGQTTSNFTDAVAVTFQ